jgi:hypothetical protein
MCVTFTIHPGVNRVINDALIGVMVDMDLALQNEPQIFISRSSGYTTLMRVMHCKNYRIVMRTMDKLSWGPQEWTLDEYSLISEAMAARIEYTKSRLEEALNKNDATDIRYFTKEHALAEIISKELEEASF